MLSPKQAAQPNPSYPALCRQDGLRRIQSNSHTNASNKTYLKVIQEKRQEETFFFRKMKKENEKNIKKIKKEEMNKKMRTNEKLKQEKRQKKREKKKDDKKEKRAQRERGVGYTTPETGPNIDFSRKNCQEKS